jgi:hypothetical protein
MKSPLSAKASTRARLIIFVLPTVLTLSTSSQINTFRMMMIPNIITTISEKTAVIWSEPMGRGRTKFTD